MVTQAERMAIMETDISTIKRDVAELKKLMEKHVEADEHRIESFNSRYAAKWTERAVAFMIGAVAAGLIAAFVTFIIKGGLSI